MLAYKIENNKIVGLLEYQNEEQIKEIHDYIPTDKLIIRNLNGEFQFADDVDWELEKKIELQIVKQNKISEFKRLRDTEELSPITYGDYRWDFDEKAQMRINGAITVLGNDTITWTSADNEEIKNVTADDLRGVVGATALRSNALHIKYRDLKAKVEEATTVEEVEQIKW